MPCILKPLLLTIILPFWVFSQSKEDSLKQAFEKVQTAEQKMEISLELTKIYKRINIDSSFKYLQIAEKLNSKHTNSKLKAQFLLAKGNYFQNTGLYEQSLDFYHLAIDKFEKLNDLNSLAKCYNSLGLTYKKISGDENKVKEFSQKALEYERKALLYYEQSGDFQGLMQAYSNIGIILRDLKDFEGAEKEYLKGLTEAKKHKVDSYEVGILKANLSQIYLDHYKNHDKAISLLNEALANYKKNGIRTSMEHAYRNISYNYSGKKDYEKAIYYAQKAVEIAIEVKDPHRQVNAYSSLHHAQKLAGMYQESLENIEIANDIEDSLFSMEKSKMIAEMNTRFDTVKKDAEITVLSKTNQLNKWRMWALFAGLMTVIFLVVSLVLKRKKDLLIHETAQVLERQKRKQTELKLEIKKKELTAKVLQLASKNEFLNSLEIEVSMLKQDVNENISKASNKISKMIRRDIDGERQWEQFSDEFSSIHQGFLNQLAEKYGTFSKTEVRLISLLKMNMNSKEIADIMGISPDGVKKARYRLRKKLALEDSDLQGFLLSF